MWRSIVPNVKSKTMLLSAAQPQRNDRGEVKAFAASSVLFCRAALKGATSPPTGEMMSAWMNERLDRKGLERSAAIAAQTFQGGNTVWHKH